MNYILNKCLIYYKPELLKMIKIQCECGKSYTQSNKARHMKSKYHLSRVDGNTPERPSTDFDCECGSRVLRKHKARHLKSKKHLKLMKMKTREYKYLQNEKRFANKDLLKKIKALEKKFMKGIDTDEEWNILTKEINKYRNENELW
jgi:ribonucleotide reductase alpha subunit